MIFHQQFIEVLKFTKVLNSIFLKLTLKFDIIKSQLHDHNISIMSNPGNFTEFKFLAYRLPKSES